MRFASVTVQLPQPHRPLRFATGLRRLAVLAPLVLAGCADAVRGISDGPTERSTKIEELTGAIAARFTSPERSSQFEGQRRRLITGALYPSRVFSDTTLWLGTTSPTFRSLSALGTLTDRGY